MESKAGHVNIPSSNAMIAAPIHDSAWVLACRAPNDRSLKTKLTHVAKRKYGV